MIKTWYCVILKTTWLIVHYDLLNLVHVYRFVLEFIFFIANDVVSEQVIIPKNPPTAIIRNSVSFSKNSNE